MKTQRLFILNSEHGFKDAERFKAMLENKGYIVHTEPYGLNCVKIKGSCDPSQQKSIKVKGITKLAFKRALFRKTKCSIQFNGWCCGSCFYAISDELNLKDWQNLLYYRGDYKINDFDEYPLNVEESIKKIWGLL